MGEVLWRQGKGANALGSSQCESEGILINVSFVVVFCLILEHVLVSLKYPSPLFSWFRFWTHAKSRMDSSLSIPSLGESVL